MRSAMSAEESIKKLEAVEAIRTLMANYCHGIDKHDVETFMSIWAQDSLYNLPRGEGKGIDGVRALVEKVWTQVPQCHHHITNPVIEVDGDTATAKTDVFYFRQTDDDLYTLLSGGYDFNFVKENGAWKVSLLRFSPFVSTSPIFKENIR
jgi:ketosteroid isomerase-like protein